MKKLNFLHDQQPSLHFYEKHENIIKIWQSVLHKSIRSGLRTNFEYIPGTFEYEGPTKSRIKIKKGNFLFVCYMTVSTTAQTEFLTKYSESECYL